MSIIGKVCVGLTRGTCRVFSGAVTQATQLLLLLLLLGGSVMLQDQLGVATTLFRRLAVAQVTVLSALEEHSLQLAHTRTTTTTSIQHTDTHTYTQGLQWVGTPFPGPPFLQSGVPRPQDCFSAAAHVPRPERQFSIYCYCP